MTIKASAFIASNPTFIKILMLATSPEDGEALAALRKATQMLKNAGLTFEELFITRESPADDSFIIKEIYKLIPRCTESEQRFLAGIVNFFEAHGYLSEKQKTAAMNTLNKARARTPHRPRA